MSQDIVSIELGLPQGDLVTLWAPRWREDGEEWEAFLGHEDDLYAFPDAAHLAAFVRTVDEHDLVDHPAWDVVPQLSVPELLPDEAHTYDLVGVPELAAEEPDTWTIGELADIIAIVRSLAEVCELDEVTEVLNSAAGFSVLEQGTFPFTGREGEKLWNDLAETIAERWDEVLDAIDDVVFTPEVDKVTLDQTTDELAAFQAESAEAESALDAEDADEVESTKDAKDADEDAEEEEDDEEDEDADDLEEEDEEEDVEPEAAGFWAEVGIDPIKIITAEGEYYTLRCYLDDEPIFLGTKGKITVTRSTRALAKHIAQHGTVDNDLAEVSTWDEVATRATDGSLDIEVDTDNTGRGRPGAARPGGGAVQRRGRLGGRQDGGRGPGPVREPRLAGLLRPAPRPDPPGPEPPVQGRGRGVAEAGGGLRGAPRAPVIALGPTAVGPRARHPSRAA
jgi:hypothetical protein